MKMTLRFVLTLVFFFSTSCIYAANQWISIIDKNHDSKEEVISQLLAIQKSLIVPVNDIPEAYQQTGFLLVPMTPEYILSLLEDKEGQIICSYMDLALVGYVILTEASEFKELYQDPVAGHFEMVIDIPNLNLWLSDNHVGYIEQFYRR